MSMTDAEPAAHLAEVAGRLLIQVRESDVLSLKALGKAGATANQFIHGLHALRIDGSPLVYNQADVYMPDLLICRKEHAERVLAGVKTIAQIGVGA